MELEKLSGIGPKSLKLLNNLGIYNMDDLIIFLTISKPLC